MTVATSSIGVCDLGPQRVRRRPFPHVLVDDFIDAATYGSLKATFPTGPIATDPPRFSLYWGDPEYDRLLAENPAWRVLFDTFHSQRFVDYCVAHFGDFLIESGCKVDLGRAVYRPYLEDRVNRKLMHLSRVELEPHELWVRMDIYQGALGYVQPVHLDAPRRLLSMLVYFCDREETGMRGGELLLHSRNPPPRFPPPVKVRFRNNRMVMFACSPRSWHSVPPITAMRRRRDYLQVLLSSSNAVW